MRLPLLPRLLFDSLTAGTLLASLAYDWLGNTTHEVIGTSLFLLLMAHNVFNRRWYGTLAHAGREPRLLLGSAITLSLLSTMLALLLTSLIISQTVFSFLPLTSTSGLRRLHASIGYLALLVAGLHVGLHWSAIMGVVRRRLGMTSNSVLRTFILRLAAVAIAFCGVNSMFALNVGSKLFMETTLEFWGFERSTSIFFIHLATIIGLFASISHYALRLVPIKRRG